MIIIYAHFSFFVINTAFMYEHDCDCYEGDIYFCP